ncbi:hypothetical protein PR202_ga29414 [Eleusine coracana subsp. coracana]|uniref:Inhibitor I9 domain-containing protein n=1 Tax=Eleusine coracana subsp. coracana TaxID=191504 RepID=A0AAV5DLA8_ELECO|nr:hypothetical protein PR202_ga29414 [Eleusine coracana subsp. coracana]
MSSSERWFCLMGHGPSVDTAMASSARVWASLSFFLLHRQVEVAKDEDDPAVEHPKNWGGGYRVQRSAPPMLVVHTNHNAKPPHFADLEHRASASNTLSGRILYTYNTVMHGFAVQLTGDEAWRWPAIP